jgi:hypothetical protein
MRPIERTIWIGPSFYRIQQLHTRDIIDINLSLEDHNQSLPIHLDAQDRSREDEFTYR